MTVKLLAIDPRWQHPWPDRIRAIQVLPARTYVACSRLRKDKENPLDSAAAAQARLLVLRLELLLELADESF